MAANQRAAEDEKHTLNSLLRMAIQQKLNLTQRLVIPPFPYALISVENKSYRVILFRLFLSDKASSSLTNNWSSETNFALSEKMKQRFLKIGRSRGGPRAANI